MHINEINQLPNKNSNVVAETAAEGWLGRCTVMGRSLRRPNFVKASNFFLATSTQYNYTIISGSYTTTSKKIGMVIGGRPEVYRTESVEFPLIKVVSLLETPQKGSKAVTTHRHICGSPIFDQFLRLTTNHIHAKVVELKMECLM